jgi:hypothetical protein
MLEFDLNHENQLSVILFRWSSLRFKKLKFCIKLLKMYSLVVKYYDFIFLS